MVIGKTEQAKRFLSRFIYNEAKEYKIPDLFGGNMESGKTKISIIYLNRILKIFDSFSDESGLIIQTSKDYPVTIENEHLKFIIAPRIDND
jgi:hypothetical protein